MLPLGPAAMPLGCDDPVEVAVSVFPPVVVKLPILFVPGSATQSCPSGPVVIATGAALPPVLYSVNVPVVVILAILSCPDSVIHTRLSGPSVMPFGALAAVGTAYSVNVPVVATLPTLFVAAAVDQSRPAAWWWRTGSSDSWARPSGWHPSGPPRTARSRAAARARRTRRRSPAPSSVLGAAWVSSSNRRPSCRRPTNGNLVAERLLLSPS